MLIWLITIIYLLIYRIINWNHIIIVYYKNGNNSNLSKCKKCYINEKVIFVLEELWVHSSLGISLILITELLFSVI